jgi:hypothetical protein
VYRGEHGLRTLKELARSYLAITWDLTRVMSRLKAIYRSWAIPCAGQQVYAPLHRTEWLAKLTEPGVHRRAKLYYQQFDALAALRQEARRELLAESRKHFAVKIAPADSLDRPHLRSTLGCFDTDAPPFSHQAPVLGLHRSDGKTSAPCFRELFQCSWTQAIQAPPGTPMEFVLGRIEIPPVERQAQTYAVLVLPRTKCKMSSIRPTTSRMWIMPALT